MKMNGLFDKLSLDINNWARYLMNSVFEYFRFSFLPPIFLQKLQCHILYPISLILLLFCFQPAFAVLTTPTRDFVVNSDGTVTHKTTGLTWMRCAMGQTWTGSRCSGEPILYAYDDAVTLTQNDWRLPNIAELQTIVERGSIEPALNRTIFPNNTPNDMFWSSTPYANNASVAWVAYLFVGGVNGESQLRNTFPVRLVRASSSLGIDPSTPDTEFTDNNNDGTVTHKRTGLMWQRCSVGQSWMSSTSSCSGTASIYTYDAALSLISTVAGYNDWRVPNANELTSIVKYDAYNSPAINTTQFPNTNLDGYWSSSRYKGNDGVAWSVDFIDGKVYNYGYNRYQKLPVRLVRSFPTVTDVTPHSATFGKMQKFKVTGTLLTPGMIFNVEDCYPKKHIELPHGTSTERNFRCTPIIKKGTKAGVIRSATDNKLLYRFTVKVYK